MCATPATSAAPAAPAGAVTPVAAATTTAVRAAARALLGAASAAFVVMAIVAASALGLHDWADAQATRIPVSPVGAGLNAGTLPAMPERGDSSTGA